MQQAKASFGVPLQAAPVGARSFQQTKGADDVGLDEVFGAMDGAVDVAFGGEVENGTGLVLGQQAATSFASPMSPFTKVWRASPCRGARVSRLPA
jgi:hypothetical protein